MGHGRRDYLQEEGEGRILAGTMVKVGRGVNASSIFFLFFLLPRFRANSLCKFSMILRIHIYIYIYSSPTGRRARRGEGRHTVNGGRLTGTGTNGWESVNADRGAHGRADRRWANFLRHPVRYGIGTIFPHLLHLGQQLLGACHLSIEIELVALPFLLLLRLRRLLHGLLDPHATADQIVRMEGRDDGQASPTERFEVHRVQLPELVSVMLVRLLARVERLLYAHRGVYLGYDAFAQVADAYVELDRRLGLVQTLVEQVELALRRSE